MPITVNSNPAATAASFYLSKNNYAMQRSINRLSSGSRIVQPNDDAGGLAVSMKLESTITRLKGAEKNIRNAISYLEVQDGVLSNVGKVMNRMIELKGLSQDVLKNSSDNDNYNREFKQLQVQLFEMSHLTFNGVSLFANLSSEGGQVIFDDMNQDLTADNTMSIYVSSDGTSGPTVSINKGLLLSALSIDPNIATIGTGISYADGETRDGTAGSAGTTFAARTYDLGISLGSVSVGVFNKALENIATLRADNGGTMSRLRYASDNVRLQERNFTAANGRIVDVDIAAESTRLAKYQILSQASASMIAQANSSMELALMLFR